MATIRREGQTRRRFVWSAAAGGLMAVPLRPSGRARAQGRPRVAIKAISVWEKPLVWNKPLLELTSRVEKKSQGELVVEWRGGPESVPPFQSAEPVSKGVFDLAQTSPTFYASALPDANAIYPEKASVKSLHASGAIKLLDEVHREKLGVILLGVPSSGIGFTLITKAPARNLEFFKGKKIRTVPLYTPLLKALGAATVTIAPAEVYPALERGVVDGVGWPEIGIEERKFHEVAKYMLFPTYYDVRSTQIMNRASFEKLPPELQKLLMDTVREVEEWGARVFREEAEAERERLRKQGVETVTLPEAEGKRFLELARETLWEQVLKDSPKYGARLKEVFTKAAQMG